MSGFIKKKSIDKRTKQQQKLQVPTLNTTKNSFRPSSSRLLSNNNKYFQQTLQKIQQLCSILQEMSSQVWQKEVSQIIRRLLEFNRGILISQKLIGYREANNLMCKFGNCLKKQGKLFNQKNTALCLNVFKNVTQQLNSLSKEQKNDQLILEAHIIPGIFQLLMVFIISVQEDSKIVTQKKPSLMRRNSLKKVSQGSITVRPSSRGKLTTLTKKDKTFTKKDILPQLKDLKQKQTSSQQVQQSYSDLQFTVFNICCIVKNLSANKKVRRDLLKLDYLQILNRYLRIWSEQKALTSFGSNILIQITSSYRHLAAQDKSYNLFNDISCNCFGTWVTIVQKFPTSNDIIFNILRILSKFSAYQDFCQKLNGKKKCLQTLSNFFKIYKSSIHIVIRTSFIFANMTSYFSDIRNQLYFDFDSWPYIFTCFQHYADSQLKGKSQVDKMGVSMAAWDYQVMRKQSDVQALIKIIRLIANIFTVQQIGQHIYQERPNDYRNLIKKLKSILQVKANIQKASQLAATVLSCLTNTLYYDREFLLANNDYKIVKKQLIDVLVDFVVQIDNQQVCCESLRVLSNLARMKQFIKHIIDAKLHEGIFILLDSTSKQIVYYSFGIIINLLVDDEFKTQFRPLLIDSIINILNQCKSQDFDIITVALKALSIIIDNRSQNINPNQLAQIQNCLTNLGSFCDNAIMTQSHKIQIQSAQQSRNLINILINNMPQQKYACPFKNCGRKFADQNKLQEHVNRRHKLA